MKGATRLYIGTSGWHYEHWLGPVYPENAKKKELLDLYGEMFSTVEINNSFHQLPAPETLADWKGRAPDGFLFAVKASRYITHMKKLKDPEEPVGKFLAGVEHLGDKLGPILFQLPPKWRFNAERLEAFLDGLPPGRRYVFEFRDPSWENDEAWKILEKHNAANCIHDMDGRLSPKKVTADFVYIRLHGPGAPYEGSYSKNSLAGWAGAFSAWVRQEKDVFCYFDNDQNGYAAINAKTLKQMVSA